MNPTTKSMRIAPRPDKVSEAKRSLWSYPKSWVKQESFYRDITTRAISGGIVAFVAYAYAVGGGYVATPSGAYVGIVILVLLGIPVALWAASLIIGARSTRGVVIGLVIMSVYVLSMIAAVSHAEGSSFATAAMGYLKVFRADWWQILLGSAGAIVVVSLYHHWRRRRSAAVEN